MENIYTDSYLESLRVVLSFIYARIFFQNIVGGS